MCSRAKQMCMESSRELGGVWDDAVIVGHGKGRVGKVGEISFLIGS